MKKWLIGFFAGACIALSMFLYAYPRYWSADAVMARKMGADPVAYSTAKSIQRSVQKQHNISSGDWQKLTVLVDDPNYNVRVRAVSALGELTGSSDAAGLAEKKMQDSNWVVRVRALKALAKLQAKSLPGAIAVAQRDTNKYVRDAAAEILAKNLLANK